VSRCDEVRSEYKEKLFMCEHSNKEQVIGGPAEAMKGADIVVAASKPGPGTIKPEWSLRHGEGLDSVRDREPDTGDMAVGGPRGRRESGRDGQIGFP
jgi:hypothetical protein